MQFLVAVEGSEQSERTLDYAIDLADAMANSAAIIVVHSAKPGVYTTGGVSPSPTSSTPTSGISSKPSPTPRIGAESLRGGSEPIASARSLGSTAGSTSREASMYPMYWPTVRSQSGNRRARIR